MTSTPPDDLSKLAGELELLGAGCFGAFPQPLLDRAATALRSLTEERDGYRKALQEITNLCKTQPVNPFLADRMDRVAIAALGISPNEQFRAEAK